MAGVQKHSPGCSCCTVAAPNHTVLVKDCFGQPEAGASVTLRRKSDNAVVGTCTTDSTGQCGVTLTSDGDYITTVVAATYTATVPFTRSSFVSPNSSQTINHPLCACLDSWPATLNMSDPFGPLVLTKSGYNWSNTRWIQCQGQPNPGTTCQCPGGPLSTIWVRLGYAFQCTFNQFPTPMTRVGFSVSWEACGYSQVYCNNIPVDSLVPVGRLLYDPGTGAVTQASTWNGIFSGQGWAVSAVGSADNICSKNCSSWSIPSLSYTLDYSALGQSSSANVTITA